jgi:hypothetical protein
LHALLGYEELRTLMQHMSGFLSQGCSEPLIVTGDDWEWWTLKLELKLSVPRVLLDHRGVSVIEQARAPSAMTAPRLLRALRTLALLERAAWRRRAPNADATARFPG